MNSMQKIMARNVVAALIFGFVFYIQMQEVFPERVRHVLTISLLVIFVILLPLRASFRHVLSKLNPKPSENRHRNKGDGGD